MLKHPSRCWYTVLWVLEHVPGGRAALAPASATSPNAQPIAADHGLTAKHANPASKQQTRRYRRRLVRSAASTAAAESETDPRRRAVCRCCVSLNSAPKPRTHPAGSPSTNQARNRPLTPPAICDSLSKAFCSALTAPPKTRLRARNRPPAACGRRARRSAQERGAQGPGVPLVYPQSRFRLLRNPSGSCPHLAVLQGVVSEADARNRTGDPFITREVQGRIECS